MTFDPAIAVERVLLPQQLRAMHEIALVGSHHGARPADWLAAALDADHQLAFQEEYWQRNGPTDHLILALMYSDLDPDLIKKVLSLSVLAVSVSVRLVEASSRLAPADPVPVPAEVDDLSLHQRMEIAYLRDVFILARAACAYLLGAQSA